MGARVIRLVGEVNGAMYLHLSEALSDLETQPNKTIDIELNSEGGVGYDGLAIAARIATSPCHIRITAYGACQSAAVIILASGDYRRIAPGAWVMVHEDSGDYQGDTATLKKVAKQMQREEDAWNDLLAKYTETPSETWAELASDTTYLTPREAFQLGLVDEILKGKR